MANVYMPDDSDVADDEAVPLSSGEESPVLVESDDEVIDVEAVSQNYVRIPRIIHSNSSSPVLIPDDDGSTTDELTDFGSETEDESEPFSGINSSRGAGSQLSRTNPNIGGNTVEIRELLGSGSAGSHSQRSNTDQEAAHGSTSQSSNAPGDVISSGSTRNVLMTSTPQRQTVQANSTDVVPGSSSTLAGAANNITAGLNSSIAEFRSPKRRRIESPDKKGNTSVEVDEEAECCPICFEPWTNSGSHRLTALKCGHLFGQSCIEKWLKGQGNKCPHCNAKAVRKDIRVIYAKALRALDTSERDRALKDLETEKQARQKVELELAQFRVRYQMSCQEVRDLQKSVSEQRQQLQQLRSNPSLADIQLTQSSSSQALNATSSTQSSGGYSFDKIIKVWEAGNCRVMAYSPQLANLVISQPSASPLFPGCGVKKLSCLDFKSSQYVSIHTKAIRDLAFNTRSADSLLLSGSMDKCVKITSMVSSTVVQSYQCTMPIWSCTWNADDKNYFYAGQQNGIVSVFDIRNTSEHVKQLAVEGNKSPIVSLQYVSRDPNAVFRPGGLIVGQLNGIMFYEAKAEGEFKPHILPSDGSLTSVSLEETTRHILASYRPGQKHPAVRHQLCELTTATLGGDVENKVCTSNPVQTFQAGKTMTQLTRSRLIHHPSERGQLLVCSPDEASCSLHIWECSTGSLKQKIPTYQPVIDVCTITVNGEHFLAGLTDKVVRLHKWNQ